MSWTDAKSSVQLLDDNIFLRGRFLRILNFPRILLLKLHFTYMLIQKPFSCTLSLLHYTISIQPPTFSEHWTMPLSTKLKDCLPAVTLFIYYTLQTEYSWALSLGTRTWAHSLGEAGIGTTRTYRSWAFHPSRRTTKRAHRNAIYGQPFPVTINHLVVNVGGNINQPCFHFHHHYHQQCEVKRGQEPTKKRGKSPRHV